MYILLSIKLTVLLGTSNKDLPPKEHKVEVPLFAVLPPDTTSNACPVQLSRKGMVSPLLDVLESSI